MSLQQKFTDAMPSRSAVMRGVRGTIIGGFALATAACATQGGFNPTPQQAREMGQGACTAAGAAAGVALADSDDPLAQAAGALLGGWGAREFCGAAAEAAAASAGNCQATTVYTTDASGRTIAIPGQICTDQGPYQGPQAGQFPQ